MDFAYQKWILLIRTEYMAIFESVLPHIRFLDQFEAKDLHLVLEVRDKRNMKHSTKITAIYRQTWSLRQVLHFFLFSMTRKYPKFCKNLQGNTKTFGDAFPIVCANYQLSSNIKKSVLIRHVICIWKTRNTLTEFSRPKKNMDIGKNVYIKKRLSQKKC